MSGFAAIVTYMDCIKQIYTLWGNAIANNSVQAQNEINKLLERNARRLITVNYSKQAYRARIVNPNNYSDLIIDKNSGDKLFTGDSGIYGFSSKKMGAPPIEKIEDGRANTKKTPCLYLASDIQTACSEVQPCCEDLISVIEFSLDSDMALIDLRNLPEELNSYNDRESIDKMIDIIFCQSMIYFFSVPVSLKNSDMYEFSQYISKYFLSKNIDGILYSSSHNYNNNAYNIVLFNPQKATANKDYGECFKCLSIQATFQNVSKKYVSNEDIPIFEAKREKEPMLWNEILMLHKELMELKSNKQVNSEETK